MLASGPKLAELDRMIVSIPELFEYGRPESSNIQVTADDTGAVTQTVVTASDVTSEVETPPPQPSPSVQTLSTELDLMIASVPLPSDISYL